MFHSPILQSKESTTKWVQKNDLKTEFYKIVYFFNEQLIVFERSQIVPRFCQRRIIQTPLVALNTPFDQELFYVRPHQCFLAENNSAKNEETALTRSSKNDALALTQKNRSLARAHHFGKISARAHARGWRAPLIFCAHLMSNFQSTFILLVNIKRLHESLDEIRY